MNVNIEDVLTLPYFFNNPRLSSWLPYLGSEFSRPYIFHLRRFLRLERLAPPTIHPKSKEVFAALEKTLLCRIRAVIVGQDPYHDGQADGLAFSMKDPNQTRNPSLKGIFELVDENLGLDLLKGSKHNLGTWAEQGVLLLNSVLSVRHKCPKSHCCQGWEKLTDKIIEVVSQNQENLVFFLWGKEAKRKRVMIDCGRGHKILCAPHPAAHREVDRQQFRNSRHFVEAKCHFESKGLSSIDWRL